MSTTAPELTKTKLAQKTQERKNELAKQIREDATINEPKAEQAQEAPAKDISQPKPEKTKVEVAPKDNVPDGAPLAEGQPQADKEEQSYGRMQRKIKEMEEQHKQAMDQNRAMQEMMQRMFAGQHQGAQPAAMQVQPVKELEDKDILLLSPSEQRAYFRELALQEAREVMKPYEHLQQSHQQMQAQSSYQEWNNQRPDIESKDAEFSQSYQHLVNLQKNAVRTQNPFWTDDQVNHQVEMDKMDFIAQARQVFKSPQALAAYIKGVAYDKGFAYQPVQLQSTTPANNLNAIREAKANVPISMAGIASGAGQSLPSGGAADANSYLSVPLRERLKPEMKETAKKILKQNRR